MSTKDIQVITSYFYCADCESVWRETEIELLEESECQQCLGIAEPFEVDVVEEGSDTVRRESLAPVSVVYDSNGRKCGIKVSADQERNLSFLAALSFDYRTKLLKPETLNASKVELIDRLFEWDDLPYSIADFSGPIYVVVTEASRHSHQLDSPVYRSHGH